jgi:hypothetical protein
MTDTTVTTETPVTQPTPSPQPNAPEARNPDGSLKDQITTQPVTTPETKPESSTPTPKDGTSIVPETYEFTPPEGYQLNSELIEKATPIFKELGLTQEQAQKLVSFQAEQQLAAANAPQEAYNTMRENWRKEVFADKSLASGDKLLPEVSAGIAKAIESLGPEIAKPFREIMDLSGVGDNPAFVRAMFKFSQAFTEGTHVTGKGPAPTGQTAPDAKPVSIANAMYPNLK